MRGLFGTAKPTADPQRDKDLFNAAGSGELDELKELIAGGADPNGHKDQVRVIAEAGHALCAAAFRRVSAVRLSDRIGRVCVRTRRLVWLSSRRRPNRRRRLNRPSRSSELL